MRLELRGQPARRARPEPLERLAPRVLRERRAQLALQARRERLELLALLALRALLVQREPSVLRVQQVTLARPDRLARRVRPVRVSLSGAHGCRELPTL